jgi:hypothetical protein
MIVKEASYLSFRQDCLPQITEGASAGAVEKLPS